MTLDLDDEEAGRLARQIASLTGETPDEALLTSLRERLRREQAKRTPQADLADELEAIARRFDALPVLDRRSADEILGYDDRGLPA